MSRRYCLVCPCRDEEQYAARTIDSVLAQSEPPALLVVVDDGSTDATPAILADRLGGVDFARVVPSDRGGRRVLGAGVVVAFNRGLAEVDLDEVDYVCKLDLDLDLPPGYFAAMMDLMERDERLGTVSGKPFFTGADGQVHQEISGDENSVGMAKFYRVQAFRDIGGLVPELMWDGIDCHELRRKGWRAMSTADPAVAFEHLRPMGSSDRGVLRGRRRHGQGQWFMGSSLPFVLVSAVRRGLFPPAVTGSANLLWGYVWAAVRRAPRYADAAFRRDLRRYQREALVLGKRRAIARWEARVASGAPMETVSR